jgi:ABC-type nitrate/sulfonate/bicarbonate transport system substrate-binding protein
MRTWAVPVCTIALALQAWSAGAQSMKIVIGATQSDNNAPIFAGVEKGFFADEGLDAKVVLYQTGVDMVIGQVNGAQQVSVLGTSSFLAAVASGFPLVMVAALHGNALADSYSENQSIIASASSGIRAGELKALGSKRIALPFGTDAHAYLTNLLLQAGVAESAVRLENGQPATLATALETGDTDAISIWEPWASATLQNVKGSVRVIMGSCAACFMPGIVLTTRRETAEDRQLLQKFIIAFARSEQWVRQHTDGAAQVDTHWIQGVSLNVLETSLGHSRFDPRISKLTIEGFTAKTIPQMLAARELRHRMDPAKAIDPEFILAAQRQDPQYFADLPPIPAAQQVGPQNGK